MPGKPEERWVADAAPAESSVGGPAAGPSAPRARPEHRLDPPASPDPSRAELRRALEAVLFLADEPLPTTVLAQCVERSRRDVEEVLEGLAAELEGRGAGIVLRRVAGGWRLLTHPEAAPYVEQFILSSRHARLTRAALETLAIVAYKQPVTRHQVSSIRGADSDGVLRSLVERGLVREVGRDEGPGRAVLYGTTPEFLERLGLNSLADLPPIAPLLDEGAGAAQAPEG
ncbi:MAG TPA: SMC-Scp complex subunit ScpB [Actinomycetota bacterium]|nr:SMC-Scp complex subunit ScpB [Actinomycetota bacterium]